MFIISQANQFWYFIFAEQTLTIAAQTLFEITKTNKTSGY